MKPWQPKENFYHYYIVANRHFLHKVSLNRLFQKCKISLCRNFVAKSANPSVDYLQQNLLNLKNAECSSAEYFVTESFRKQSADPSVDYSLQNLLNFNAECLFVEYFVAESFRSQIVDPSVDCSQQNLLNFRSAECLSAEYFIVENFSLPGYSTLR